MLSTSPGAGGRRIRTEGTSQGTSGLRLPTLLGWPDREVPSSARRLCSNASRPSIPATRSRSARSVHDSPFQLLVATILSAQCTDEMVNKVTPAVFARYPTPADLAHADPTEVEELIHPTGFFRQKTKSLIGMATALDERFER